MTGKITRQLFLMRHAKSSWNNANLSDHDRPLNGRGRKAAPEMAEWLESNGYIPELVRCSTATRALETAELVIGFFSNKIELEVLGGLYHAPPETLRVVAGQSPREITRLMLVAHNPGLNELVNQYADRDTLFPTAAIACLEGDSETWGTFFAAGPKLRFLMVPKEIED
jgi:phosphohistidine phosphatase